MGQGVEYSLEGVDGGRASAGCKPVTADERHCLAEFAGKGGVVYEDLFVAVVKEGYFDLDFRVDEVSPHS